MIRHRVTARDGRARAGVLETPHGAIPTPAFMPVATKGAVKTLSPKQLREAGVDIVLSNTYHLCLRPGEETVRKLGGLHGFMGWDGPILTDSGGYQIFSLARVLTLDETGVNFRSHIDGAAVALTPERALDIQIALGSDVIMPLDQPVAYPCAPAQAREAMERTHRWLERTMRHRPEARGRVFGIVQGAFDRDLRRASAAFMSAQDFPGIAVGGLSMGEPIDVMIETADFTVALLPEDRARYLMGVGTPADLVRCIGLGFDLFDCVLPTRLARTGWAFTSEGVVRLRNSRYRDDASPLDPACACATCRSTTRAYLRHCFNTGEVLGLSLVTYHNLYYYMALLREARAAVAEGRFGAMLAQVGTKWRSLPTKSA